MANLAIGTSSYGEAFEVLKSLNGNAETLRTGHAQARDALISDCFRLVASLETPSETFMRTLWTHVCASGGLIPLY